MFRILFILFVVIPIIEIAVLMQVGEWLGAWPTVAVVVITAWLGAKNVKQQGVATLHSVQSKMATGEMPSDEIVAGLLLLVAGVLLVTPGFVTDFFGLSLLIPAVRNALIGTVKQGINVQTMGGAPFQQHQPFNDFEQHQRPEKQRDLNNGSTIEGEYERKE